MAILGRAADDAEAIFRAGQRAEAAGDTVNALMLYARAADLDPDNLRFLLQQNRLQIRTGQLVETVLGPDPEDEAGRAAFRLATEQLSPSDVLGGEEALPPPLLRDSGERHSFDLRGTARLIFEEVGEAYGIDVVFEADYQEPAAFTYRIQNATLNEALRVLEATANSFVVPLNDDTALVLRDTAQNRTDRSPMVAALIPIPDRMSVEDAQEIASGVQQTMELRRIAVDAGRRAIFLRDQESKVLAARKILSDLARPRAQIAVEVELLSVSRNSSLEYGLSLPTSFPVINFSSFLNNMPAAAVNVALFGGGRTLLGMGIADASAFATLSRGSSQTLLRSQVVSLDGQQVSMHVGDRYPIVTGRYGDPGDPTTSTPLTTFQDLGLTMDLTPAVHADGEVSLAVEAEFSVLGATAVNDIPIISTRAFQGTTRLKFGEWAVIAGLAVTSTGNETTGIPLLSQIPWVGGVFRRNSVTQDSGQVLIVLKPRLLSLPPWETPAPAMWVGTETNPVSVFSEPAEASSEITLAQAPPSGRVGWTSTSGQAEVNIAGLEARATSGDAAGWTPASGQQEVKAARLEARATSRNTVGRTSTSGQQTPIPDQQPAFSALLPPDRAEGLPQQPRDPSRCVMLGDVLCGIVADLSGGLRLPGQPRQIAGQHGLLLGPMLHPQARVLGDALDGLPGGEDHRLADTHHPDRDPGGFPCRGIAQISANIDGGGVAP